MFDFLSHSNLCNGSDICYSTLYSSDPGKQMCDHFKAGCTNNQWLCPNKGCISLSQPCRKNRESAGIDGCVKNYRGKRYQRYYCKTTDKCVSQAKSSGGSCASRSRFKCRSEDKCIHRRKVTNGVSDCKDKSDELLLFNYEIFRDVVFV